MKLSCGASRDVAACGTAGVGARPWLLRCSKTPPGSFNADRDRPFTITNGPRGCRPELLALDGENGAVRKFIAAELRPYLIEVGQDDLAERSTPLVVEPLRLSGSVPPLRLLRGLLNGCKL